MSKKGFGVFEWAGKTTSTNVSRCYYVAYLLLLVNIKVGIRVIFMVI